MKWLIDHQETRELLERYVTLLALPTDRLRVTTERRVFESWLGRRLRGSIGGAYTFAPASGDHLILINLPRIDQLRPRSLEVVVAEELLHMRDRLDGDLRRHAKHGHDRIAHRVSALTGATLDEIRASVLPPVRRPARYVTHVRAVAYKFLDTDRVRGRVEGARRGSMPTSSFNCSQCLGAKHDTTG